MHSLADKDSAPEAFNANDNLDLAGPVRLRFLCRPIDLELLGCVDGTGSLVRSYLGMNANVRIPAYFKEPEV